VGFVVAGVAFEVALQDVAVVAQTHLPVAGDVVLQDVFFLGVAQDHHAFLGPLQQGRLLTLRLPLYSAGLLLPPRLVLLEVLHIPVLFGQFLYLAGTELGRAVVSVRAVDAAHHRTHLLLGPLEGVLGGLRWLWLLSQELVSDGGWADEVVDGGQGG